MFKRNLPRVCGLILGVSMMMTAGAAHADALKDEIAPSGKLRVAIAISPAGGAFWSTKNEAGGYAGVPVDLGKEMAAQLGVPVEYVVHQNSGQIVDAVLKGTWDVTFLPKDPEREARMFFGPIYEVADATYIVKAGSSVTNFQALDRDGIKVAAVNNTTTMRGALAHLKNARVTGYQTYDEIRTAQERRDRRFCAIARPAQCDGKEASGNACARRDLQANIDGRRGAAEPSARAGLCRQVHGRGGVERIAAQGL